MGAQDREEDQQQRRRDQHAQHRRSGDNPDGNAAFGPGAHHFGHCHLGKDCRRGDGNTGDRGKDGIGQHRRNPEAAAPTTQSARDNRESIATHAAFRNGEAHQHKQRHNAKRVIGNAVRRGERHEVHGKLELAGDCPDPEERHTGQGNRNVQPGIDGNANRDQRQVSDGDWVHDQAFRCSLKQVAAVSRKDSASRIEPSTIRNRKGQTGRVKCPCTPSISPRS